MTEKLGYIRCTVPYRDKAYLNFNISILKVDSQTEKCACQIMLRVSILNENSINMQGSYSVYLTVVCDIRYT